MSRPGARFLAEIRDQPEALARLAGHAEEYERVGAEIARRGPAVVRLVGHGSSDAAASSQSPSGRNACDGMCRAWLDAGAIFAYSRAASSAIAACSPSSYA